MSRNEADRQFSTLQLQQQWLMSAITRGAPSGHELDVYVSGGKFTSSERLEVYRRAYLLRLIDCLRDDFPAVAQALGDAEFENRCCEYIERHPPNHPSLNFFGREFATYLHESSRQGAAPWLWELATLEWAVVTAIHADCRNTLALAELSLVPVEQWERLQLRLSPSAQLFEFRWEVSDYLSAIEEDSASPPPLERAQRVAVVRGGDRVWRLPLEPWAHFLLQALAKRAPLGEAMEATAERFPEIVSDLPAVMNNFRNWVSSGVFAGFQLHQTPAEPS